MEKECAICKVDNSTPFAENEFTKLDSGLYVCKYHWMKGYSSDAEILHYRLGKHTDVYLDKELSTVKE